MIEYYSTISDLPIKQFNEIQKLHLINTGIGSNITDFDKRLANLYEFIKTDNKAKALTEIENLRMLFNNVINKNNTSHFLLTKFVKTIKKKPRLKFWKR